MISVLMMLLFALPTLAERYPGDYQMYGTVNNKWGIEMKVTISGDSIFGSYKYDSQNGRLSVNGTVQENGTVVLYETDPNGKRTGVFRGSMVYGHLTGIEGTWSSPDGRTSYPFRVHTRD